MQFILIIELDDDVTTSADDEDDINDIDDNDDAGIGEQ